MATMAEIIGNVKEKDRKHAVKLYKTVNDLGLWFDLTNVYRTLQKWISYQKKRGSDVAYEEGLIDTWDEVIDTFLSETDEQIDWHFAMWLDLRSFRSYFLDSVQTRVQEPEEMVGSFVSALSRCSGAD